MNRTSEKYLSAVNRHLKPLPKPERIDIIKEVKSALLELEQDGLSETESLKRLGDPKELAKAYLTNLLARDKSFHFTRFLTVCAFYSLAGISGLFVIPILGITAPSFLLFGILSFIAGAVKLLDDLLKLGLPFTQYIGFEFNSVKLSPIPSFFFSVGLGTALFLAGYSLWKLLLLYCRKVGKARDQLL